MDTVIPVTPPKFLAGVYYSIVATVKHYRDEKLERRLSSVLSVTVFY